MPTWEDLSLPVLRVVQDGNQHRYNELVDALSDQFGLTAEERAEQIPSGRLRIYDRVYWACQALAETGLVIRPERGLIVITDSGRELLKDAPEKITKKYLIANFRGYADFQTRSRQPTKSVQRDLSGEEPVLTPLEEIDRAIMDLRSAVEARLLERLKGGTWQFFQVAVLAVLAKLGYGWDDDAAKVSKPGPDGGVDGEIREDPLGLEMIYVQAKRYTERNVPVPDIDRFVGALTRKRSRKGVFITTSDFSTEAISQAERIEGKRVKLINGTHFVRLMIDHGVGVVERGAPKIYDVDENFFADELSG